MKTLMIRLWALAAVALCPWSVQAAPDGTITFHGAITAFTCVPSVNGGSNNYTVVLPPVPASTLSAAGLTAGQTPFVIQVVDDACRDFSFNRLYFRTFFEPGPTISPTGHLRLDPSPGTASNVELQLLKANGSPIDLNQPWVPSPPCTGICPFAFFTDEAFFVRYLATGQATPGTANSSVQYTLVYE